MAPRSKPEPRNARKGYRLRWRLRDHGCFVVDGCGSNLARDKACLVILGIYSFREWQSAVRFPPGKHELKVRAINRIGQSQPMAPLWNPAGYMRNVVEVTNVIAA